MGSHMPIAFPNESQNYRKHRDKLLAAEIALRDQTEAVAALRRTLPDGGEIPLDYPFVDLNEQPAPLSELFGAHDTLAIYSLMFGPGATAPCLMWWLRHPQKILHVFRRSAAGMPCRFIPRKGPHTSATITPKRRMGRSCRFLIYSGVTLAISVISGGLKCSLPR